MQIVFGRNPNLPTSLTDTLPALESKPETSIVGTHLAALQSARQEFIKAESSEKIKRALRKQTRQWRNSYQIGDAVFYRREDSQRWKGPAKVLGQDGSVVFLRHGARYIKAHLCRVQLVDDTRPQQLDELQTSTIKDNVNENQGKVDYFRYRRGRIR